MIYDEVMLTASSRLDVYKAVTDGLWPWNPPDLSISLFSDYNFDYDTYPITVEATSTIFGTTVLYAKVDLRRDDLMDMTEEELRWLVCEAVVWSFRSIRLIEPEDHIILGEN